MTRSAVAPPRAPDGGGSGYRGSPLSIQGIRSGVLHGTFVKIVLGLLIVIFGLGLAVNGVGNFGGGSAGRAAAGGAGPDPVAQVGNDTISRQLYQGAAVQQISMMQQFGQPAGVSDVIGIRQRALQSLVDSTALYQAAQKEGLSVSDAEIDKKLKSQLDQEINPPGGADAAANRRRIESQEGSLDAYRQKRLAEITEPQRQETAHELMTKKLEDKIKDANKVTEEDYKRSVTKLKLRVIKVSAKPPAPAAGKTAPTPVPDNPQARAEALVAKLKAKPDLATFVAAVAANSDDITTKKKGGDLGWKLPSELPYGQKIKDTLMNSAAQLVGPLQDEFMKDSFYIYFVEGRKLELPKDYAKKKAELIKTYKTQKNEEVWSHYQEDVKKGVQAEIYDPELLAYKIQTEKALTAPPADATKLRQDALAKYQEALNYAGSADKAAIHYQMAQIYRQTNQPAQATEMLQSAVKESPSDDHVRMELASALQEQKKVAEALVQLQKVTQDLDQKAKSGGAPQSSMMMGGGGGNQDAAMRFQLATEYEQLNRKDLAAAERKKIKMPAGAGGASPFGMGSPMGGSPMGGPPMGGSPMSGNITIPPH